MNRLWSLTWVPGRRFQIGMKASANFDNEANIW